MTKIFIFDKAIQDISIGFSGKIKDINGVNGSPRSIAPGFPDLNEQMNQMGIKYFRFHDNLGFGDLDNSFSKNDLQSQLLPNIPTDQTTETLALIADLGNIRTIFPNAAKGMRHHDINLALSNANYGMTDQHFKDVMTHTSNTLQREILFRVGRTNRGGAELPEDFDIYAQLAGTLAERYSRDYQQIGLPRKITYWEIWNEPDLKFFWNDNNPTLYYEFYAKVARAIKQADPSVKVGGPTKAFGYDPHSDYIDGFLAYCQKHNVPLDFYSWHFYGNDTSDPQNIIDIATEIQTALNKYGFSNAESLCTEWNSCPMGNINIYSKVQSAKNAAYIASTLIYMNHVKIDKAFYYRGDASSFGLFNKEAGYCTYAAQAFHLYSRLFETPNIIYGGTDFSSGLTLLACQNKAGNKINILAANYEVDPSFADNTLPTESPLYKQYHVDGSRPINQLTDSWSKKEWFGGIDPTTIHPDNFVQQKPTVTQIMTQCTLSARPRSYIESSQGLQFSINNIEYASCKIKALRIQEGNPLCSMVPKDISTEIAICRQGNTLTVTDPNAIRSTVTLYTIDLD